MHSPEHAVTFPPYVTDPRHLTSVEGISHYAVMRPTQTLAAAYFRVQEEIRGWGFEGPSYPAPHLTMKAFGDADESEVTSVVEAWASNAPPVLARFEAVDAFADFGVLIAKVERQGSLVDAMTDLRQRAVDLVPGSEDSIPVESWVFHMSLTYATWMDEGAWAELQERGRALELEPVSDYLNMVDLLAFDGGPERLVGSYALRG